MIPAGRTAVDIAGLAELHGLSIHQARARRPWNEPSHPAPLTVGRPGRGHPLLWDREQAAAYARGQPIPPRPDPGNPNDLLDVRDAADLAGLTVATWNRYESKERTRNRAPDDLPLVPPPDELVCSAPHWYRRTIEQYRTRRATSAAPRPGRPPGTTEPAPRTKIAAHIAELVENAKQTGENLSIAEIARRAGVHYNTAHTHVRRSRETT